MSSSKKQKLNLDDMASELSGSAFFAAPDARPQAEKPTSSFVGKSTSIQNDKPAKPQVEKYTTHLEPEIVKAIKLYAVQHDMKDYEVVRAAITEYLERQQGQVAQASIEPEPVAALQVSTSRSPQPTALPVDLIPLYVFADLHGMARNKTKELVSHGSIHAVKGTWSTDKGKIDMALDARGRRDFWIQFHSDPGFRACDDCPHQER